MTRRRVDAAAGRAFRRMALLLAILVIGGVTAVFVWVKEPGHGECADRRTGSRRGLHRARGPPAEVGSTMRRRQEERTLRRLAAVLTVLLLGWVGIVLVWLEPLR